MPASCVNLESDAYLVCLTHALSTEREEVMGLLIGEVKKIKKLFSEASHPCTLYIPVHCTSLYIVVQICEITSEFFILFLFSSKSTFRPVYVIQQCTFILFSLKFKHNSGDKYMQARTNLANAVQGEF